MRRLTFEEFCKKAHEVIGDDYLFYPPYKNMKTPVKYKHLKCGTTGELIPYNTLKFGNGCKHCGKIKKAKAQEITLDEFKQRLHKVRPKDDIELIEPLHGLFKKTKAKCLICGYGSKGEWTPLPINLLNGRGCPNCAGNAPKQELNLEQEVKTLGNDEYELKDIRRTTKDGIWLYLFHRTCGHLYWVRDYSFMAGNRCPYCNQSHGEQYITEILNEWGIKFIPQKRFKGCYYKRTLPFDFYLPELNTCIEYDGEQHTRKSSRFYSDENIKRDHIKNQYCQDNGIKLIRIPYTYDTKEKVFMYLKPHIESGITLNVSFKEVPVSVVRPLMLKSHYLHRTVATKFSYALYANGKVAGMITYTQPRESLAHSISDQATKDNTLELSRLYIKDYVSQNIPNITSKFVGWSLRQLKQQGNYFIISFADSGMQHIGAIYQATNFLYCGMTSKSNAYAWNGYGKHGGHWEKGHYYRYMIISSQKYRYVTFVGNKRFKKQARKSLTLTVQSYPKGDEQHYQEGETEVRYIRDKETNRIYREDDLQYLIEQGKLPDAD